MQIIIELSNIEKMIREWMFIIFMIIKNGKKI